MVRLLPPMEVRSSLLVWRCSLNCDGTEVVGAVERTEASCMLLTFNQLVECLLHRNGLLYRICTRVCTCECL